MRDIRLPIKTAASNGNQLAAGKAMRIAGHAKSNSECPDWRDAKAKILLRKVN